jgi:hypothetical protein
MLVTAVASMTLGRALWPGAATQRVVRGTITAVSADRTAIGFMPDGHRDPYPPPSLLERLADMRYGFHNTFNGYDVGGVLWEDAEGAWHQGTAPACLVPNTAGQRVELGLVSVLPSSDGAPAQCSSYGCIACSRWRRSRSRTRPVGLETFSVWMWGRR